VGELADGLGRDPSMGQQERPTQRLKLRRGGGADDERGGPWEERDSELRSASLDLRKRISGVEYNVEWRMFVVQKK
jgi:hypothetical protein